MRAKFIKPTPTEEGVTITLKIPKEKLTKAMKYEMVDMEGEEIELTFPQSSKAIMGSSDSANISHIRFLMEKIGEFVDTVEADMGPELEVVVTGERVNAILDSITSTEGIDTSLEKLEGMKKEFSGETV